MEIFSKIIDCKYNSELKNNNNPIFTNHDMNYDIKDDDLYGVYDHADVIDHFYGTNYRNDFKLIMVQYEKNGIVKRRICNFLFEYDDYGSSFPVKGFDKLSSCIEHNEILWIPLKKKLKARPFLNDFLKEMKKNNIDTECIYCLHENYSPNDLTNEYKYKVFFTIENNGKLYAIEYDINTSEFKSFPISLTKKEFDEYKQNLKQEKKRLLVWTNQEDTEEDFVNNGNKQDYEDPPEHKDEDEEEENEE